MGGRVKALTEDEIAELRRAWRNREEGDTVESVALRFGVGAATLRRHIPSARGLGKAHKGLKVTDGLEVQRQKRAAIVEGKRQPLSSPD